MAADKKKDIDVSYASGWLRGRLATMDESTGEGVVVAGLLFRARLSRIISYQADMPGVITLYLDDGRESASLIGSIDTMDKIMAREGLKEVKE